MFRITACLFAVSIMLDASIILVPAAEVEDRQQVLIDVLQSDTPAAEKASACRELKLVGDAKSVPALASLLDRKGLSHEARIALESMPCPEAGAALCEAVAATSGLMRAGLIDSLGERRDVAAVPIVASSLADPNAQVVASAALALGKMGTSEAARLLSDTYTKAPNDRRAVIGDGLVRCADALLQSGKTDAAVAIYNKLARPSEPPTIRTMALRGLVRSAGDKKSQVVRELLASDDPVLRGAGAIVLPDLFVADFQAVATGMSRLPAESQIALLTAIRIRGDRSLASLAIEATRSENEALARAGLAAVGTVAGASGVNVLLSRIANNNNDDNNNELERTAWQSLEAIRGPGVDTKLVDAMRLERDPTRRARFLGLLVTRNAIEAVPSLFDEARVDNGEIRAAAIAAVRHLASPADVPAMVSLMLDTPKGADRDEIEKAVMLVVQRIPEVDKRAEAVLDGVGPRSDSHRIDFLPVLGRIGGPKALELVQSALKSQEAGLYEAGVRAIANWPDASVAEQLLELSRDAREDHHRIWALRALIRVTTLPSETPDAAKLAMLERAMGMAARNNERAFILQRAAAVRSVDTLRFVTPYLDQPALAQAACHAVVELAHHKLLREPNKQEFDPALKKVITIGKDRDLVDRAKRYLAGH